MPRKINHSLCLVLVLLSCVNITYAQTRHTDFLLFKKRLYEINISNNSDSTAYDLQLKGPRVHIGSAGASEALLLRQYDTIARLSFDTVRTLVSGESMPFALQLGAYKVACINLLARLITSTAAVSGALTNKLHTDEELENELGNSYSRVKDQLLKKVTRQAVDSVEKKKTEEIAKINQLHYQTFDSLVQIIDQTDEENRYGGNFMLADADSTGVPVYYHRQGQRRHIQFDTNNVRFYVDTIVIKTFNNFIDQVVVVGSLYYQKKRYPVAFYNGQYSIPLKHLFQRKQSLGFTMPFPLKEPARDEVLEKALDAQMPVDTSYIYYINVSDLIRLTPYHEHFTFMAKNDSYLLTRKKNSVKYARREFYDYLTFTTFLDFLGVMERTPNSLIQMEGNLRMPLRLLNSRIRTSYSNVWFPKIDVDLNATFINGSQADTRYGTIYNQSTTPASLDTLYIDNFDLVRKYNIRTGFELGIFKRENKSSSINLYMDYGLHFYRTTLRYLLLQEEGPDEEQRFNSWSFTHGPIVRAEYRPDQNIGADLSFEVNFNQKMLNSDNDNLYVYEVSGPLNKNHGRTGFEPANARLRHNFKMELNAYFLVNPRRSNGGLYFRMANYFSYNFSQMFPQLMIGYSTRLTGMIKNFRTKAVE
jgi:hypothetical protein